MLKIHILGGQKLNSTCLEQADRLLIGNIFKPQLKMHSECALRKRIQRIYDTFDFKMTRFLKSNFMVIVYTLPQLIGTDEHVVTDPFEIKVSQVKQQHLNHCVVCQGMKSNKYQNDDYGLFFDISICGSIQFGQVWYKILAFTLQQRQWCSLSRWLHLRLSGWVGN